MIIDVSFLNEFQYAEGIESYWELMNYFKGIPEYYFKDRGIYYEKHHIYPIFETIIEIPITINLPFYFHFRAHLLRARELTGRYKGYNYSAAYHIIDVRKDYRSLGIKRKQLQKFIKMFPEEVFEAKYFQLYRSSAYIARFQESKK